MSRRHPYGVELRFRTRAAREYFLGQLSDGWGENVVMLDWPEGGDLKDASTVNVKVLDARTDFTTEILTRDDANPWRKRRRASQRQGEPQGKGNGE